MNQEHGNYTENTSFVDVLKAVKQNIFKTMQTAELCVVRESNGDGSYKCEFLTNSQIFISAIGFQNADIQVNDVVLVVFTGTDYRASLNAYKNGDANTSTTTLIYHQTQYGVIVGCVYRRNYEEDET